MPDSPELYQPTCEALRPYCGPETAINNSRKAFAFILGALTGNCSKSKQHVESTSSVMRYLASSA